MPNPTRKMLAERVSHLEAQLSSAQARVKILTKELESAKSPNTQAFTDTAARTFTIQGTLSRMAREGYVFGVEGVGVMNGRHCIGITMPCLKNGKPVCRWIALAGGTAADHQAIEFFRTDKEEVVATVRQGRADVLPILVSIQMAADAAPKPLLELEEKGA